MNNNLLQKLKTLDGLQILKAGNKEIYLHNEHRWALPIAKYAQSTGAIPRPCTMVMFDRHCDFKEPLKQAVSKIADLGDLQDKTDALIDICTNELSPLNDDWIKAGMELGLITDAVSIGAKMIDSLTSVHMYNDHRGKKHLFGQIYDLVNALDHKGALADIAGGQRYKSLRDILGWEHVPKQHFKFTESHSPIWIDFDLDCFSVDWGDYLFPWPEKIWQGRILNESNHSTTRGMTGQWFIKELIKRAGLITIAREPKHCGGEDDSDEILRQVNRYLFEDRLQLEAFFSRT